MATPPPPPPPPPPPAPQFLGKKFKSIQVLTTGMEILLGELQMTKTIPTNNDPLIVVGMSNNNNNNMEHCGTNSDKKSDPVVAKAIE